MTHFSLKSRIISYIASLSFVSIFGNLWWFWYVSQIVFTPWIGLMNICYVFFMFLPCTYPGQTWTRGSWSSECMLYSSPQICRPSYCFRTFWSEILYDDDSNDTLVEVMVLHFVREETSLQSHQMQMKWLKIKDLMKMWIELDTFSF